MNTNSNTSFRIKLTLYFIVLCTIFLIPLYLLYAQILSADVVKLNEEMDNIDYQQSQNLTDFKQYLQVKPYDCSGAICEIHVYNAPPYDNTGKGYTLIMTTENSIQHLSVGKESVSRTKSIDISTTTPKL